MDTELDFYLKDAPAKICEPAERYLGRSGTCFSDCPFNDCVISLDGSGINSIMKTKLLMNIFSCMDAGMDKNQIIRLFDDVPPYDISYYIRNREKLFPKIQKYGIVEFLTV